MVRAGTDRLLRGYKEISLYLERRWGIDIRMDQLCRWKNSPVLRFPVLQPNARVVYGDPTAIDAWVEKWLKRKFLRDP